MGLMTRKISRKKRVSTSSDGYQWLPIDSMFVPNFQFSHVRGLARIFLSCEIILSVLVVLGTLSLVALHFL
jgi:hypothetical protein